MNLQGGGVFTVIKAARFLILACIAINFSCFNCFSQDALFQNDRVAVEDSLEYSLGSLNGSMQALIERNSKIAQINNNLKREIQIIGRDLDALKVKNKELDGRAQEMDVGNDVYDVKSVSSNYEAIQKEEIELQKRLMWKSNDISFLKKEKQALERQIVQLNEKLKSFSKDKRSPFEKKKSLIAQQMENSREGIKALNYEMDRVKKELPKGIIEAEILSKNNDNFNLVIIDLKDEIKNLQENEKLIVSEYKELVRQRDDDLAQIEVDIKTLSFKMSKWNRMEPFLSEKFKGNEIMPEEFIKEEKRLRDNISILQMENKSLEDNVFGLMEEMVNLDNRKKGL